MEFDYCRGNSENKKKYSEKFRRSNVIRCATERTRDYRIQFRTLKQIKWKGPVAVKGMLDFVEDFLSVVRLH